MIEFSFYKNEMKKIFEQFGVNKFSTRKVDLIYGAIKYLTNEQLAQVVDDIVGNCKYSPNLDDFRDRARKYNNNSYQKTDCTICGGDGIVSVNYKKNGAAYAFSCKCKNGRLYPSYLKWENQNANLFTRLPSASIDFSEKKDPYEGVLEKYNSYINRFIRKIDTH